MPRSYALSLSKVVSELHLVTGEGKQLMSELSMMYYNNLLSLPLIFLLAVIMGDYPKVRLG